MLVITAFLFPAGCAAEPEEQGLTELAAEESAEQKADSAEGTDSRQTVQKERTAGRQRRKDRSVSMFAVQSVIPGSMSWMKAPACTRRLRLPGA